MGKTFKKNSEDFNKKKSSYSDKDYKKSNRYKDANVLIEDIQVNDSDKRKNKYDDIYDDPRRR